jgi:hypothetical protein
MLTDTGTMEISMEVPQKKKKEQRKLSYNTATPLLGLCLNHSDSTHHRDTCIHVHVHCSSSHNKEEMEPA